MRSRFNGMVNAEFGLNFAATAIVVVTWFNVGYYDRQNDKVCKFDTVGNGLTNESLFIPFRLIHFN